MASSMTRQCATMACYFMRRYRFTPGTILNIGVGSCPELETWRWLLPEVPLLGIDVRGRHRKWNAPYIAACLAETSGTTSYCGPCRSTKCTDPSHWRRSAPGALKTVTLDSVVESKNCQPPYFIWMDIDGSELQALRGGIDTLSKTNFINIELNRTNTEVGAIRSLLANNGFSEHYHHHESQDYLFMRRRVPNNLSEEEKRLGKIARRERLRKSRAS